jgi:catechol 2,3-dioxygenase-like lactoylglutathione lyase family enzyme
MQCHIHGAYSPDTSLPRAKRLWHSTRRAAGAKLAPTRHCTRGTQTMPLNALHHITVQTDDLEATRDFYRDVLGLKVGFRPELNFPGYWLYCGDVPVVHLVPKDNAIGGGPSPDTGNFDHFAFLASDFQGIKSTLDKKGVKYRENHIAQPPIDQLFFPDNNNVMVELNFPRA